MTPAETIAAFVLEHLNGLPDERRIELLRALAIESTDPRTQKQCRQMAAELELFAKQHAEVLAYIRRKQNPGSN